MPENKIMLTVVVSGVPTDVEANIHAPLHTIIPRALEQTGNTGQPPENWELKDADGNVLDLDAKIEDFQFDPKTKLFLSLKAGIGG